MKKLLKATLLFTLLTNLLTAEILFDLDEQQFSSANDKQGIMSKYSLPNIYIKTNLDYGSSSDRYYMHSKKDSFFEMELKTPLDNLRISFDIIYSFAHETHTIQLIDVNGNIVTLGLSEDGRGFNFNGNLADFELNADERIYGTIKKTGHEFEINLNNGVLNKSYSVTEFSQIKYIKFNFIHDVGYDALDSMLISIDE